MKGRVIAVVGAESTGKTRLAQDLAQALEVQTGARCTWVPEWLRGWCGREGRTPQRHEQAAIAAEQQRLILQAADTHAWVVADTTPLMTAVYSRIVFQDHSLDAQALEAHAVCDLTLLTANDLPWEADGLQRDGPQVRPLVTRHLRELMLSRGIAWSVVAGSGAQRLESALDAVTPTVLRATAADTADAAPAARRNGLLTRLREQQSRMPAWQQACEKCDDPMCEHLTLRAGAQGY